MGKKARVKREKQFMDAPTPQGGGSSRFSVFKMLILGGAILAMFAPLLVAEKCFFPFVGGKSIYFMAFCEVIFFAWLALISFNKQYRPKKNIILIVLGLFICSMAVSSFLGADFSRSFWSKHERMTGLLMWLHLFGFFLATSSVFKKMDWLWVFIASNFTAVLVSFGALFFRTEASRGGGTLGNDSFLGTYLLFNIFIALYLFFFKFKEKPLLPEIPKALKIFSITAFSILAFCLLFEGTQFWDNLIAGQPFFISLPDLLKDIMTMGARAAKYSFLGGIALLGLLYLVFEKGGKKRIAGISVLVLGAIAVLTLFYLTLQPGSFAYEQFAKLASKARMVIWGFSWDAFLERPLLGWGPENFELAFPLHFDPRLFMPEYGTEVWFDRAHNILMDNLVSLGIIGSVLYLALFAAVFWVLWKAYLSKKIDFFTAAIPSVALIAYFIQNLTVFDMVTSLMMFFMIMGFAASIQREDSEDLPPEDDYYARNKRYPLALILIFIVFIFSFVFFIFMPMRNGSLAIEAINAPTQEERIALYQRALAVSPVGKYQETEFFTDQFSNFSLSSEAVTMPVEQMKNEFSVIAGLMRDRLEDSPLDFRIHLKLGQFYNVWSRIDQSQVENAQECLEKALKLNADNQQVYWALAQTKLIQGKNGEAIALADLAIELEPRVKNSHFMAIRIAKMINDQELFEEKKAEALKINSDWRTEIEDAFPN